MDEEEEVVVVDTLPVVLAALEFVLRRPCQCSIMVGAVLPNNNRIIHNSSSKCPNLTFIHHL